MRTEIQTDEPRYWRDPQIHFATPDDWYKFCGQTMMVIPPFEKLNDESRAKFIAEFLALPTVRSLGAAVARAESSLPAGWDGPYYTT